MPWTYIIGYLKDDKIVRTFYKKELQKTTEFRIEKVTKRKGDKLCVDWRGIIRLTSGLMRKILLYIMSYFPEPWHQNKIKIKVEFSLSNYATKSDLKNAAGVDTSRFAKNNDLASFKLNADQIKIDELEKAPSVLNSLKDGIDYVKVHKLKLFPKDLRKLSDVDDKGVLKKIKI